MSRRAQDRIALRGRTSLLAAVLLCCGGHAHATTSPERAAVLRLCRLGPDQTVAQAQRLQGEAEVAAAGVLPNPDLVVQHERVLSGREDHETILGLSVPLGIGGRRFLLQDAAAARRDQAQAAASETLFDAAVTFRRAYARAVLDKARTEVLVAHQRALESLADTVEALVQGSESAPYDLLRQQTQARLHQLQVASMSAQASASQRWLDTWLGTTADLTVASLGDLAGGHEVLVAVDAPGPRAAHPRVRGLKAASRASAIEADAARRRAVPDVSLFAAYRTDTSAGVTGHGLVLGVTVPLTFFDHGQGEARRADADKQLAAAEAARVTRANDAHLSAQAARLTRLEEGIAALDQVVNDGAALRSAALLLYRADEASIAEVLDAYRVTEAAELARLDAIEELANARFEVMRAAGRQFDPALDKACSFTAKGEPR